MQHEEVLQNIRQMQARSNVALVSILKEQPDLFSEEHVRSLVEAPEEERKSSIFNAAKQFIFGYLGGLTTVQVGRKEAKSPIDVIARNAGQVLGLFGFLPGPGLLGKIYTRGALRSMGIFRSGAMRTLERAAISEGPNVIRIESIPMKVANKVVDVIHGISPESAVAKFLETRGGNVVEEAIRFGTLSSVMSWQDVAKKAVDDGFISGLATLGEAATIGALEGAGFRGLTNYVFKGKGLQDIALRALSSSLYGAGVSAIMQNPWEVVLYDFLVGGVFGAIDQPYEKIRALELTRKVIETGDPRNIIKLTESEPVKRYLEKSGDAEDVKANVLDELKAQEEMFIGQHAATFRKLETALFDSIYTKALERYKDDPDAAFLAVRDTIAEFIEKRQQKEKTQVQGADLPEQDDARDFISYLKNVQTADALRALESWDAPARLQSALIESVSPVFASNNVDPLEGVGVLMRGFAESGSVSKLIDNLDTIIRQRYPDMADNIVEGLKNEATIRELKQAFHTFRRTKTYETLAFDFESGSFYPIEDHDQYRGDNTIIDDVGIKGGYVAVSRDRGKTNKALAYTERMPAHADYIAYRLWKEGKHPLTGSKASGVLRYADEALYGEVPFMDWETGITRIERTESLGEMVSKKINAIEEAYRLAGKGPPVTRDELRKDMLTFVENVIMTEKRKLAYDQFEQARKVWIKNKKRGPEPKLDDFAGKITLDNETQLRKEAQEAFMDGWLNNLRLIERLNNNIPYEEQVRATLTGEGKFLITPQDINKRSQLFNDRGLKIFEFDRPEIVEEIKNEIQSRGLDLDVAEDNAYMEIAILPHQGLPDSELKDKPMFFRKGDYFESYAAEHHLDGAFIVRQDVFDLMKDYSGLEPEVGAIKASMEHTDAQGLFLGKMALFRASDAENEFLLKHKLHGAAFDSAIKQRGYRKQAPWTVKGNSWRMADGAPTYKVPLSSFRYNLSSSEHFHQMTGKQRFPRQWITSVHDPALRQVVWEKIIRPSVLGDEEMSRRAATLAMDSRARPEDFKDIDWDKVGVHEIVRILDSGSETAKKSLYKHLLGVKESPMDDEVIDDADVREFVREISIADDTAGRILNILGGDFSVEHTTFPALQNLIDAKLTAYIRRRITNPEVDHMTVVVMRPETPAIRLRHDGREKAFRPTYEWEPGKKLQKGHFIMSRTLAEHMQIEWLDGKRVTVKEAWEQYKKAKREGKDVREMERLLTFNSARVPIDAPSGIRVLKLAGIGDFDGATAIFANEDMMHMGGADLDIDKAYITQSLDVIYRPEKGSFNEYYKQYEDALMKWDIAFDKDTGLPVERPVFKEFKELVEEQVVDKEAARRAKNPVLALSPHTLLNTATNAYLGNKTIGPFAVADRRFALAFERLFGFTPDAKNLQNAEPRWISIRTKAGKIPLFVDPKAMWESFSTVRAGGLNIAADAGNYPKLNLDFNRANEMLIDAFMDGILNHDAFSPAAEDAVRKYVSSIVGRASKAELATKKRDRKTGRHVGLADMIVAARQISNIETDHPWYLGIKELAKITRPPWFNDLKQARYFYKAIGDNRHKIIGAFLLHDNNLANRQRQARRKLTEIRAKLKRTKRPESKKKLQQEEKELVKTIREAAEERQKEFARLNELLIKEGIGPTSKDLAPELGDATGVLLGIVREFNRLALNGDPDAVAALHDLGRETLPGPHDAPAVIQDEYGRPIVLSEQKHRWAYFQDMADLVSLRFLNQMLERTGLSPNDARRIARHATEVKRMASRLYKEGKLDLRSLDLEIAKALNRYSSKQEQEYFLGYLLTSLRTQEPWHQAEKRFLREWEEHAAVNDITEDKYGKYGVERMREEFIQSRREAWWESNQDSWPFVMRTIPKELIRDYLNLWRDTVQATKSRDFASKIAEELGVKSFTDQANAIASLQKAFARIGVVDEREIQLDTDGLYMRELVPETDTEFFERILQDFDTREKFEEARKELEKTKEYQELKRIILSRPDIMHYFPEVFRGVTLLHGDFGVDPTVAMPKDLKAFIEEFTRTAGHNFTDKDGQIENRHFMLFPDTLDAELKKMGFFDLSKPVSAMVWTQGGLKALDVIRPMSRVGLLAKMGSFVHEYNSARISVLQDEVNEMLKPFKSVETTDGERVAMSDLIALATLRRESWQYGRSKGVVDDWKALEPVRKKLEGKQLRVTMPDGRQEIYSLEELVGKSELREDSYGEFIAPATAERGLVNKVIDDIIKRFGEELYTSSYDFPRLPNGLIDPVATVKKVIGEVQSGKYPRMTLRDSLEFAHYYNLYHTYLIEEKILNNFEGVRFKSETRTISNIADPVLRLKVYETVVKEYPFRVGQVDQKIYWPRNGHDMRKVKEYLEELHAHLELMKKADAPPKKIKALQDTITGIKMRYHIMFGSAGMESPLDAMYSPDGKTPWYKEKHYRNGWKPQFLHSRGEYPIPGYDRTDRALFRYVEQLVRSQGNTLISTMGHFLIEEVPLINYGETPASKHIEGWKSFMRLQLRNLLGVPSVYNDTTIETLDLKKKWGYWPFTDQAMITFARKLDKWLGTNKLQKLSDPELVYHIGKLSTLEGKYELMTLLFNSKSYVNNVFGGSLSTIYETGIAPWRRAVSLKYLQRIAPDRFKSWDDVARWAANHGAFETWLINEAQLSPGLDTNAGKRFLHDVSALLKEKPFASPREIVEIGKRYGLGEQLLSASSYFMRISERKLRLHSFLAHYIKARDILLSTKATVDVDDPWAIALARKGVENSQFLYNNALRPMFGQTPVGRVYTRFRLWMLNSIKQHSRNMMNAVLEPFTDEPVPRPFGGEYQKRFERMILADSMVMALAAALPFSLFDATLPGYLGWIKDYSEALFGDDEEKRKAFFGMLPWPANMLQPILPPAARFVEAPLGALLSMDFDRFLNYHIFTMFPGGIMVRNTYKAAMNPPMMPEYLAGIPAHGLRRFYREASGEGRGIE